MRLARAVAQAGNFFREVLANPMKIHIKANMTKTKKVKVGTITDKEKKALTEEEHFSEYDKVMELYLNKF
jgi:hypothetical protein